MEALLQEKPTRLRGWSSLSPSSPPDCKYLLVRIIFKFGQCLDLFPFPVSVWENVDPDRSESHEVDDPDVGEDVGDEGGEPDDEEEQEEGGRGGGGGGRGGRREHGR